MLYFVVCTHQNTTRKWAWPHKPAVTGPDEAVDRHRVHGYEHHQRNVEQGEGEEHYAVIDEGQRLEQAPVQVLKLFLPAYGRKWRWIRVSPAKIMARKVSIPVQNLCFDKNNPKSLARNMYLLLNLNIIFFGQNFLKLSLV